MQGDREKGKNKTDGAKERERERKGGEKGREKVFEIQKWQKTYIHKILWFAHKINYFKVQCTSYKSN